MIDCQQGGSAQERTELFVPPPKTGVLHLQQEAATDRLPIHGPHVRSCVLSGGQPQAKGQSMSGPTGEEGRLRRWCRAGQPDICGRVTDSDLAPVHH